MATNPPETGRRYVNRALGATSPYAMDVGARMAQGESGLSAVKGAVKDNMIMRLLGPTAIWAGATAGVLKTMERIVKESGVLERGLRRIATLEGIESKFEGVYKSAERAASKMREIQNMSLNMPFRTDDIAQGALILERLTKGAYSGAAAMREVGDAAAATGNSFSETAQGVGKLMAAIQSGRSLDKMMFQMQQTGLMTDEVADKLERLEAAGRLRIEGPKVIREMLQGFKGGMANDMNTLDALTTKNAEASSNFDAAFGKAFTGAKAKALESSTRALQNMTPVMERLGDAMSPIVTVTDSIKERMMDLTLSTKTAQTALLGLITVGAGALKYAVAYSAAGILGHAGNAIMRHRQQRGRTAAALDAARGSFTPDAQAAMLDVADQALINDPEASMRTKWAARWRRVKYFGANSVRQLQIVHQAASTRMNQTEFDPKEGFNFGGSGIGRYAGVWARQGTKAGWGIAKAGASMLAGAMGSLVLPLLGVAALTAATALTQYADKCEAAAKRSLDLRLELSSINNEAMRMARNAKTAGDWAVALGRAADHAARLREALRTGRGFNGEELTDDDKDSYRQDIRRNLVTQKRIQEMFWQKNAVTPEGASLIEQKVQRDAALREQAASNRLSQKSGFAYMQEAEAQEKELRARAARFQEIEAKARNWEGSKEHREAVDIQTALSNDSNVDPGERKAHLARVEETGKQLEAAKREMEAAEKARKTAEDAASAIPSFSMDSGAHQGLMLLAEEERKAKERFVEAGKVHDSAQAEASGVLTPEERTAKEERLIALQQGRGEMYALETKQSIRGLDAGETKRLAELRQGVSQIGEDLAKAETLRLDRINASWDQQGANMALGYAKDANTAIAQGRGASEIDRNAREAQLNASLARAKDTGDTVGQLRAQADLEDMKRETLSALSSDAVEQYKLSRKTPATLQGVEDYEAREQLREQYRGAGLTDKMADAMFQARLMAQARNEFPRIQTSSLQAIGGGGSFYTGADPMKSVQDRIAYLTQTQVELLQRIADATSRGVQMQ